MRPPSRAAPDRGSEPSGDVALAGSPLAPLALVAFGLAVALIVVAASPIGWLGLALVVPLVFGLAAASRGRREARRGGPVAPGETLRERYARGKISRPRFREALLGDLKERYVRGEIDLVEYEARLAPLISDV